MNLLLLLPIIITVVILYYFVSIRQKRKYLTEDDTSKISGWISFYKMFYFGTEYSKWFYFDERPCLMISATQIIVIISVPFIIVFADLLFLLTAIPFVFFGYGKMFIHLPIKTGREQCGYPKIGYYYYKNSPSLVICKGFKTYHIDMPWCYSLKYKKVLMKNGKWDDFTRKSVYNNKDNVLVYNAPYSYKKKDGEIQKVYASFYVEEFQWRQKWLFWTNIFSKNIPNIDIEFDDEIGEGVGSWKGGCIGCSYTMKKGETPLQTLRRMEKERKF